MSFRNIFMKGALIFVSCIKSRVKIFIYFVVRIYLKFAAMNSSDCKMDRNYLFWKLKNLVSHPGGEANSLVFSVGNPCYSLCYIRLFISVSKKGKQALSHDLVFLRGSYQEGFTYRIHVVGKDGKLKPLPLFKPCVKNCHFLEKKFFTEGSVTLRCRLTFRKEPFGHTTYVKGLSTRIGCLRDMNQFADLVLCSGGEEFHVNKFLLKQRCPKLLEHLGINDKLRAKGTISTPVLKALLRYVYTGTFGDLPVKYDQEFHEMSEVCEFEEFTKEILYVKTQATLCSEIRVFQKKIFWDISVENATSRKIPLFKPIHLGSTRFLLNASVKPFGRGILIQIKVCCGSALEGPILLNCSTSIVVDENELKSHPEVRLQFSPEDKEIEKHLKYVCNKKLQKDSSFRIVLSIVLSRGENTCVVEDIDQFRSRMCSDLQSVFGMGLLSVDLKKLYMKTRHGDVDLVCKGIFKGDVIHAHKAILAASSPVLKRMLSNAVAQNSNSIDLYTDVHCGNRILRYLYSGEVYNCGYESDLKLFEALNRYEVSNSDNTLTKLFVSHLEDVVRLLKQQGARKRLLF